MSEAEMNAIILELSRQRDFAQNRCVQLATEIARLQNPAKESEQGDE